MFDTERGQQRLTRLGKRRDQVKGFFDASWNEYLGLMKILREQGVDVLLPSHELAYLAEDHSDAKTRELIREYLNAQEKSYRLAKIHGGLHQKVNRAAS